MAQPAACLGLKTVFSQSTASRGHKWVKSAWWATTHDQHGPRDCAEPWACLAHSPPLGATHSSLLVSSDEKKDAVVRMMKWNATNLLHLTTVSDNKNCVWGRARVLEHTRGKRNEVFTGLIAKKSFWIWAFWLIVSWYTELCWIIFNSPSLQNIYKEPINTQITTHLHANKVTPINNLIHLCFFPLRDNNAVSCSW